MKRREAIRNLSILPVSGVVLGSAIPIESMTSALAAPKRDIFKELGIRTFINAAGTYTAMSGCIMHDEVVETIKFSSQKYARIDDCQDAVGKKIAEMCHAEAAMVTAGCWSALVLGTAGVLTGTDPKKVAELPHLDNMKSEVLVQKEHNHGYVHALTNTGIKVVEVETKDLIAAARLNAPPRGGNIGRGMKVNKEEILGMYVALEKFINRDHQKQWKIWEERIAIIEKAAKSVNGVTTVVSVPPVANITPTLTISWDISKIKVDCNEFRNILRKGNPSIEMMGSKENLVITSWNLKDGEEKIVAARIAEELKKASA
ncbi:MAG: hypothetical protein HZB98_02070 [Bacteroidia bacterium]|nr:hypothetical protein [Bacteroidia bacterium]